MDDVRLSSILSGYAPATVRAAVKLWAARTVRDARKSSTTMHENGWERVTGLTPGAKTTPNMQPVVWVNGESWAMTPDEIKRRLAVERAESAETKSVVGTESLTQMVCPKCGDALQHTAVCPSCAAGKLGYRHRYACVCGVVDLISKEAL
jgi:rubrerythrin